MKIIPCWKAFQALAIPEIRRRREENDSHASLDIDKWDYLSVALEQHPELSHGEITELLLGTLFAALTTSKDSLAHTLIAISSRPEVKEKLLKEAIEVGEVLDSDSVKKLVYHEACIKEALRLGTGVILVGFRQMLKPGSWICFYNFDFVSFLFCHLLKNRFFSPVTLKDGTVLEPGMNVSLTGQAQRAYDPYKPNEFCPERWLNEANTPPTFLAFGTGVHKCPGRFFATTLLSVALSLIIRRYDVTSVNGVQKTEFETMERPLKYSVKFEKRKN